MTISSTLVAPIATTSVKRSEIVDDDNKQWIRATVTVRLVVPGAKFVDHETLVYHRSPDGKVDINIRPLLKQCTVPFDTEVPPTISGNARTMTVTYKLAVTPKHRRHLPKGPENEDPHITAARLLERVDHVYASATDS